MYTDRQIDKLKEVDWKKIQTRKKVVTINKRM